MFDRRLLYKPSDRVTTTAHRPDATGGIADHEVEVRYAPRHDGSHPDHCKATNCQITADDASCADTGTFSNQRRSGGFVRLRGSKALQIWRRRPRIAIVGENHPSSDHDPIFNGDGCADIHEGVDFNPVPNDDIVRDISFLADNAFTSNQSSVPYVNIVPD